jgi:hypothetical protein
MDIMLGKEMVEEWKSFDIQQAIKDVKVPTKIIFAGEYNKFDIREELLPNFSSQLEYATVP